MILKSLRVKYSALEVLPKGRNFKKLSEVLKSGEALLFNLKVHTNLTETIIFLFKIVLSIIGEMGLNIRI